MAIEKCLILTSRGEPIAEGVMGNAESGQLSVKVLNDEVNLVAAHEIVQIVGMGDGSIPQQCMLTEIRGNYVILNVLSDLNAKMRSNIRISTRFDSFLYPVSGAWKGRRDLTSVDISCGGLAFYSTDEMEEGERVEVVIPVTSSPLLIQMEILSKQDLKSERAFYKAKFVDMHHDQECMIREAVFGIQLDNHARKRAKEKKQ